MATWSLILLTVAVLVLAGIAGLLLDRIRDQIRGPVDPGLEDIEPPKIVDLFP